MNVSKHVERWIEMRYSGRVVEVSPLSLASVELTPDDCSAKFEPDDRDWLIDAFAMVVSAPLSSPVWCIEVQIGTPDKLADMTAEVVNLGLWDAWTPDPFLARVRKYLMVPAPLVVSAGSVIDVSLSWEGGAKHGSAWIEMLGWEVLASPRGPK